ncbi:MAG: ROK family protein [Clostridiales bacterium]|nr:ROK family protein [Clostridiales bacterium]
MYYVGIDIGGMTIKAGLVDENGRILAKKSCATKPERHYSCLVADMYNLLASLAQEQGIDFDKIKAIGIGCPGTVNTKKGIITYSGNLNFINVDIIKEFKKHTDLAVCVGNDANCAALGEVMFGGGKGTKNAILITLGTGVGTGFVVDGKILEGVDGAGAEGGHICIKMDGQQCTCGEKGCWEAYASATALMRITKEAMKNNPHSLMHKIVSEHGEVSGRTAFLAYKTGDKAGQEVVNEYVKNIAWGLVNLVNIFRPEIIMIGGGVSHEGEYFIKMIEKVVVKHAFGGKYNKVCPIVAAALGNDAGIVGAAALAMQEFN